MPCSVSPILGSIPYSQLWFARHHCANLALTHELPPLENSSGLGLTTLLVERTNHYAKPKKYGCACQCLLELWLAVVRQREIDVERQRTRLAGHARENGLGFAKLRVSQPGRGDAHFGFLQILDAENLAFRLRLHARRKVFAKAFAVHASVDLKNNLARGIREL